MTLKKFSVTLCLLVFALQLSSPLVACIKNCHSSTQSCHFAEKQDTDSQTCPHSKAAPKVVLEAKSGCDCTLQAGQLPAIETCFTFDFSRTETSKLSVADFDSSLGTPFTLLDARLHGPPLSLALTGQNTFLLNSNLRI